MMIRKSMKMSMGLLSKYYDKYRANLTPLAEGGSNLDLKVDIVSLGGEMIGKLKFRMEVVGGGF